jgi:hypothetical protein
VATPEITNIHAPQLIQIDIGRLIVAFLIDLLRTPSSFEGQPVAATRNQGGHTGLGMLAAWYFGAGALPFIGLAYAVWEALQWRVYGGQDWDCVEDWCFLMTGSVGAAMVPFVPWYVTVTQFGVMAAWLLGVYLRRVDD